MAFKINILILLIPFYFHKISSHKYDPKAVVIIIYSYNNLSTFYELF